MSAVLGSCPVVKIAVPVAAGNPHGFTEINASDYDAGVHTLFVEPDADAKAQIVADAVAKANADAATQAELDRVAAEEAAAKAVEASWGSAPAPSA